MPALGDSYLSASYAERESRWVGLFTPTRQWRTTEYQEWATPYIGEPPLTRIADTPAGFTWISPRNDAVNQWATDGVDVGVWLHRDLFSKIGEWEDE